jgi:uncharacterized membrane protein
MSGAELGLAGAVFLASAVECVEALTIVLAVGSTRSWSSAFAGTGAALALLAAVVAVAGAGLGSIPLTPLRIAIGALLLAFGLQWLRKAVLRAAGRKALRQELLAYREEVDAARTHEREDGRWDPYSFSIAFKGVLLEGFEVALIVVTLGAQKKDVPLAAGAAVLAALSVTAVGVAVRHPLARVPENAMKMAVGVMLCSFGVFWLGEGLGVDWPGGEGMLAAIVAAVLACTALLVLALRRVDPALPRSSTG